MPRYRFQAIDGTGRVVRGVLRADDAESGRSVLREESLYPKTLEEVSDEEKVTWSPRNRIKAAVHGSAASHGEAVARIVRAAFATECVRGYDKSLVGEVGLADDDRFLFQPKEHGHEPLVISAADVEQVSFTGLMTKLLTIVLVSGKSYEFTAGSVFPNSSAKLIASTLAK